jgi:hypothetical protein
LGQKSNFGEAINHHALWLDALNFFENSFRRFPKLKVRRVEQTLMLVGI